MRAPMHNFILLSLSFFALTTSFPSTSSFSLTTKPHYPRRRVLHQPLFPLTSALPPETVPLSPPPPPGSDKDEPFNPEVPPATLSNGSIPVPAATQPVKKVAIAISVGIVTLGMLSALAFFLYRYRVKSTGEGQKLFDGEDSRAPPSTFLYIGTVEPSRSSVAESNQTNGSPYHKLNSIKRSADRYRPSPDLQPLPPLPKPPAQFEHVNSSPPAPGSSSDEESRRRNGVNTINNVPRSKRTSPKSRFSSSSSSSAASPEMKLVITPPMCKPPPPPLPRARTETAICTDDKDGGKPKLKPLHWDKVRATSDRATVWDQIKFSSFKLNEDKMESLFGRNSTNSANRDPRRRLVLPPVQSKNRALDPKKSQNIAILLNALNVTADEVSEALLDGNPESLGVELLETLVKMAPTKEEEIKLRDYHGDVSKLGAAERFLKAVLDVPFAFKRVEAMLYRANFDTEVAYLRRSFQTLEEASEELKNSKLFPKLLEAVLRTGNRMNVGTNRGDAKAFMLETLLKLIDIKGTDGKTTVLHFVVQEIIRSEGLSGDSKIENLEPITQTRMKEEDFRKQGLQVVSRLSRDLGNVKKAAGMDSDVLLSYVSKLESGLEKVRLVLQYEQPDMQGMFFKSKKMFVREADEEITSLKMDERKALALVKEVTEYFHGDTAKEGAQPFRIFMIVRDFLNLLDHVCKDVGMMQDRMVVGAARSFRISATASLPVLNRYNAAQNRSSVEEIT